jgi:thiol:disulfide interchange protein DsbC
VTVFTDIDSAFSRKLHRELASYLEAGIKLRYLFFPRAGVGSPSYSKAVTVWCSSQRKQAMSVAITGAALEELICPSPVERHLALGKRLGVSGAPALLLENGEMLPGYIAAERLAEILERMASLKPD